MHFFWGGGEGGAGKELQTHVERILFTNCNNGSMQFARVDGDGGFYLK